MPEVGAIHIFTEGIKKDLLSSSGIKMLVDDHIYSILEAVKSLAIFWLHDVQFSLNTFDHEIYTHHKIAHTKIMQNFWLSLIYTHKYMEIWKKCG